MSKKISESEINQKREEFIEYLQWIKREVDKMQHYGRSSMWRKQQLRISENIDKALGRIHIGYTVINHSADIPYRVKPRYRNPEEMLEDFCRILDWVSGQLNKIDTRGQSYNSNVQHILCKCMRRLEYEMWHQLNTLTFDFSRIIFDTTVTWWHTRYY